MIAATIGQAVSMLRGRRWSLRLQLVLLMATLVVFLTAALGWVAYRTATGIVRKDALHAIGLAASARRQALVQVFLRHQERGETFARLAGSVCQGRAVDPAACLRRLLREFATLEGASAEVFAPKAGPAVVVGETGDPRSLPMPRRDQLVIFGADEFQWPYYLARIQSQAGDRLVLRFDVERLEPIFGDHYGLGQSGEAFLVDGRGFFITPARSHSTAGVSQPIATEALQRCLSGHDGEIVAPDYRGIVAVQGFRYLPEAGGICLVAQMDRSEAFAPLASLAQEIALVVAGFAAVAFGGAILMARRLTQPIQQLTERTRSLRAGDLESAVPVGGMAEVRTLGDTFADMAASLRVARRHAEAVQRRAAFLAEASAVLASSLDYAKTLTTVAHLSVPYLADLCIIDLLTEDGRIDRVAVAPAKPDHEPLARELREDYPPDPGGPNPVARVLRTGRAELVEELSQAALKTLAPDPGHRQLIERLACRSYIVVPLTARGRTLGAISLVAGESGRRYTAGDLGLAEEVARRAGVAMDNARLYLESEGRRQVAEALAEVGGLLSGTLDLDVVGQRIVETVSSLLGTPMAVLYRIDAETDELVLLAGMGVDLEPNGRLPASSGSVGLAVRERQPVVTPDVFNDARISLSPRSRTGLHRSAYRAIVAVPLMAKDRVFGALATGDRIGRTFTPDDVRLLQAFAHQAAVALENARLYSEERAARLDAEVANRAKDEFLAVLSHELRTPLTAMLGWVRILRSGRMAAEQTERALETIERNTRLQSQIINDLLDVSRIVAGKLQLEKRAVDFGGAVEEAMESLTRHAEAKGVRVETALDPGAGPIFADPVRIQQIVVNLVSNAIKFTPAEGRVEVRLERHGADARLTVRDNGLGIDPAMLPHVFDRFRQADSSSARGHEGLGLGLAIVRHLVELHEGTVRADSAGKGTGATFTVDLPVMAVRMSALPKLPADADRRNAVDPGPRLTGLRTLVVDDHADARELVRIALEQYGAEVVTATSVADALGAMEQARFDVVVSDVGMPGADGYELIARIRERERARARPATPAVALTAYSGIEDHQRALAAGFQRHIAKPIDPDELADVVARAAGRSRGTPSADATIQEAS